jgi:hypothetical protein
MTCPPDVDAKGGRPLANRTGLLFGLDAALDRVTKLGVAQMALRNPAG